MSKIVNKVLDFLFPTPYIDGLEYGEPSMRPTTDGIYALFSYKDKRIKKAIWKLKYAGRTVIVEKFAELLYDRMLEELSDLRVFEDFKDPVLTPIPLSKERLRERGFNQAELLAKRLCEIDGGETLSIESDALVKTRETKAQMSIKNRAERLQNVVDCFSVEDPAKVRGRNIILIDDITTTGATLNEARKVLREAGAKNVICFAIAH